MQSRRLSLLYPVALAGLLALLISCGGSSDKAADATVSACESSQTASTAATYDQLWTNVFSSQCKACHGQASDSTTVGGPDMTTKALFYSELVGKKGSDYQDWDTFQNNRADCNDVSFIAEGSASQSMVVAVLDSGTSISGCTIKSHLESPQSICISTANLAKLKEWIDAGAAQ